MTDRVYRRLQLNMGTMVERRMYRQARFPPVRVPEEGTVTERVALMDAMAVQRSIIGFPRPPKWRFRIRRHGGRATKRRRMTTSRLPKHHRTTPVQDRLRETPLLRRLRTPPTSFSHVKTAAPPLLRYGVETRVDGPYVMRVVGFFLVFLAHQCKKS